MGFGVWGLKSSTKQCLKRSTWPSSEPALKVKQLASSYYSTSYRNPKSLSLNKSQLEERQVDPYKNIPDGLKITGRQLT